MRPPTSTAAASPIDLASCFKGEVRRVRKSPFYHIGLLLIAVLMVLLPCVYLALTAAFGFGLYWYAIHGLSLFEGVRSGATAKGAVFVYVAPLFIGGICLLFMIKPLFAPRARRPEPITLNPSEEPLVYGFVEVLSKLMGAPVPRRIDVTCEVNASASFRRGYLSFLGNDMVLTIGLPLVAGMNLRQLTGVLAHELGHFAQGAGMRSTYLIGRINGWFARVVYQRDGWDEQLEEWSQGAGHWAATIVVLLARFFVGLTRLILRVLMYIGHGVNCFMGRQQEFDADRYEARVAGSAVFAPTFQRLIELSVSMDQAHRHAKEQWAGRQLPDDLPALAIAQAFGMPGEVRRQLHEHIAKEKTGFFDSHPATKDRIRKVEKYGEPGVFSLEAPATVLFRDFATVCKRTTYLVYRSMLGDGALQARFVPVGGIVEKQAAREAMVGAFERVFAGAATSLRPLVLTEAPIKAPKDPRAAGAQIKAARDRMAPMLGIVGAAAKALNEADDSLSEADRADAVLDSGLRLIATRYHLTAATREAVAAKRDQATKVANKAGAELDAFKAALRERLREALSILMVPGAEKRITDLPAKRDKMQALVAANVAVASVLADCHGLRRAANNIEAVMKCIITEKDKRLAKAAAVKWAEQGADLISRVHQGLDRAAFPFAADDLSVTIAGGIMDRWPDSREPKQVYEASFRVLEGVMNVYYRSLAELAALAEEAEAAIGLKPVTQSSGPPSGTAHPPRG